VLVGFRLMLHRNIADDVLTIFFRMVSVMSKSHKWRRKNAYFDWAIDLCVIADHQATLAFARDITWFKQV
jgi:hypothetical protein